MLSKNVVLSRNMTTNPTAGLSNRELLDATARAIGSERRTTAELLALLAELDTRRLYLGEGYSSLFTYCTQALHLSEHSAYHRIEAARAARKLNHDALLSAARHKSKREVERQIAALAPRADAKTVIRRVPMPPAEVVPDASAELKSADPAGSDRPEASVIALPPLPARPVGPAPKVLPLSSERFLLRVTLSARAHARLRQAQDLMRHQLPTGDPSVILERALDQFVDYLEKQKLAITSRPRPAGASGASRPRSRHIPAAVRRAVWRRDGGRCAFAGPHGRCSETGHLEFHHVVPFARGGLPAVANIALRCRAHNGYEAERAGLALWRPAANSVQT